MSKQPDYIVACSVFGGRSPKTGKPVGSRHRWSGNKWGDGYCIFCNRQLEQVCESWLNLGGKSNE